MFDFPSADLFHRDLNEAYTTSQLLLEDDYPLRYIDCKIEIRRFFSTHDKFVCNTLDAIIEQQMPMRAATTFWLDTLCDCKVDQPLPLPVDRQRISDDYRTGRGTTVSFDFGEELSRAFLARVSMCNTTPEYMTLACYYAFLFKLTNGEKDLCIGRNTHGRYKPELMSLIGMFVNAIPLRCQLDPHWSFKRLVNEVYEIVTDAMNYSYFPLQRILAQHPLASKPMFLDTSFVFGLKKGSEISNEIMIGDVCLGLATHSISIGADEIVSKFDFSLNIYQDSVTQQLSCTIEASLDLFETETINRFAQRFHIMLKELFEQTFDWLHDPIYKLSLMLPDETQLVKSMNEVPIPFSPGLIPYL
ncbi:unnamed protein product [Rotaria sp. Silwood2]|nr:unnamed protein product [Rotaria sp. Silwood2]CAF4381605.1 unnamed protein product [Rotaria sp. Silwood2]